MHRTRAFPAVLLVTVLAGCSDPNAPDPREPRRGYTVHESHVADASIGFGLKLYQAVSANESRPNIMISPLSVSMALGMTMNGAEGETLQAMRSTLGFGGFDESAVNEAYRGLIAQLLARDSKVDFRIANSIWHEQALALKSPFLSAAKTFFGAEVAGLDFASPQAPRTISAWAERATNGRIKDLVNEISRDEVMFLVNAIYFKAPWASTFDSKLTRNGAFHRADGSTVSVSLMNRDANFHAVRNDEVMAVELFYADSAFSMIVAAPENGGALDELEHRLTTAWWKSLASSMRPGRVYLTLPKFRLAYDRTLRESLETLGMDIAFDARRADFSRISDSGGLYITRVDHKTFIEVDERGTEAAAATSVGIGLVSAPPRFTFDRPFFFAIRERESGALLFIGRIGDPTR